MSTSIVSCRLKVIKNNLVITDVMIRVIVNNSKETISYITNADDISNKIKKTVYQVKDKL